MTAMVYLIVHLAGYPAMPGVVVGVFSDERTCIAEAYRHGFLTGYGPGMTAARYRFKCEVRT